jgi:hypothetical protein
MTGRARAEERPERTVQGNVVVSRHDPDVRIVLPAAATYAGSDRWVLKAYADDIELHAFVAATPDKHVKRIYWVQFEAYLPSQPQLKHTYNSKRHVTRGGMDFYLDTWVESPAPQDPDSDQAHLDALLRAAGYILPKSMMSVRLVHLMDGARKELMFIYSEDTAPTGFSVTELDKGGAGRDRWREIERGLIGRAERSITFH